jgi:hypothetical protein
MTIYEMPEPLMLRVKGPECDAEIDVIMAGARIGKLQKENDTVEWDVLAELFRPWLAQKMNVDPEAITLGQVAAAGDVIIEANNRASDENKKKLSTTLSSLFSTPESPTITDPGPQPPSEPGSETTPPAKLGEAVFDDP